MTKKDLEMHKISVYLQTGSGAEFKDFLKKIFNLMTIASSYETKYKRLYSQADSHKRPQLAKTHEVWLDTEKKLRKIYDDIKNYSILRVYHQ